MTRNLERLNKLAEDNLLSEQDLKVLHRAQVRKGALENQTVTPFRIRNDRVTHLLVEQGFREIERTWGTFPKCHRFTKKEQPYGCSEKDKNGGCALASCRKRFKFTALLPPFGVSKEKARKIVDRLIKSLGRESRPVANKAR